MPTLWRLTKKATEADALADCPIRGFRRRSAAPDPSPSELL